MGPEVRKLAVLKCIIYNEPTFLVFQADLMQTIYRRYRPQDFKGVYGQEAIVKVLKKQIEDERVGHAYLFTGPRGTGKTSVARLLAKAVNCEEKKVGDPCRKCYSCLAIEQGRFLDLIEIDAASNRGIDEIRRLRERVGFSPSEGSFKVYIIDEVHMLTKDAFNALLKTLEEPPEHVIFILATTEPHKIPSTILSRCQRFNFTLADDPTILKRLQYICKKEKIKFTKEALMAIVKNSTGSFRDAESILEKVIGGVGVLKDNQIDLDDVSDILGLAEESEVKLFIDKLLEKDIDESLKIFDKLVASGVNLFQLLRQALEYCRELLIQRVSKERLEYSLLDLLKVITELSEAENKLKYTSVARLPIEIAIVNICSMKRGGDISREEALVKKAVKKNIGGVVTDALTTLPKKIKSTLVERDSNKNEIDLDGLGRKWAKIIESISPFNHHLSAFFKKAVPVEISKDNLILQVPFRFHKQRIESPKAQEIFLKVTKKVIGVPLKCACEVSANGLEEEDQGLVLDKDKVVLEVLGDIIE